MKIMMKHMIKKKKNKCRNKKKKNKKRENFIHSPITPNFPLRILPNNIQYPLHPANHRRCTLELIFTSLEEVILSSTLYNEIPPDMYIVFRVAIVEEHTRYLERTHLYNRGKIVNNNETYKSFLSPEDILRYNISNSNFYTFFFFIIFVFI
jgi:hypothetical protein